MSRVSAVVRRTASLGSVGALVAAALVALPVGASARPAPAPGASSTAISGSGVSGSTRSVAGTAATRTLAVPSGYVCTAVRSAAVNLSCVIGRSVAGRAIVAQRQGSATSKRVLVVVGQMHGEEWPGPRSVDVVRSIPTSARATYTIWTVRTMNPDGGAVGRRRTNHGVDLNRNFPNKFLRMADSGPRALSEPESAAMARFLTWVQPDLVVSLHGFSTAVDTTGGGQRAAWARRFSGLSRITPAHAVPCGGPCHGNMTDWYSATTKVHGVAFTVEMPRSSKVPRACSVPGHTRGTPIQCVAWAAAYLAPRLPA